MPVLRAAGDGMPLHATQQAGVLHIRLVRATGLQSFNGPEDFSNPYAIVAVVADGLEPSRARFHSGVCQRTCDPLWDESFQVRGQFDTLCLATLRLLLFHEDESGFNPRLGEVNLDLSEVALGTGRRVEAFVPLMLGSSEAGAVDISVKWEYDFPDELASWRASCHSDGSDVGIGIVHVRLNGATMRHQSEGHATSDLTAGSPVASTLNPFAEVSIGAQKLRSNVVVGTSDPRWEEDFYFLGTEDALLGTLRPLTLRILDVPSGMLQPASTSSLQQRLVGEGEFALDHLAMRAGSLPTIINGAVAIHGTRGASETSSATTDADKDAARKIELGSANVAIGWYPISTSLPPARSPLPQMGSPALDAASFGGGAHDRQPNTSALQPQLTTPSAPAQEANTIQMKVAAIREILNIGQGQLTTERMAAMVPMEGGSVERINALYSRVCGGGRPGALPALRQLDHAAPAGKLTPLEALSAGDYSPPASGDITERITQLFHEPARPSDIELPGSSLNQLDDATGRLELTQTAAPSPPPTRSTSPGCMEKLANTAEAAEASTAAMLSAAEHAEAEASAALDVVREQVLAAAAAHEEVQARARAARMQVSEAQAALAIAKERHAIAEQAHQAALRSRGSPGITARKVAAMARAKADQAVSASGHALAMAAADGTAVAATEAKEHLEELVKAEQQIQSEHWRLRLHTTRAAAAASWHGAMHGVLSQLARVGANHVPNSPSTHAPPHPDGSSSDENLRPSDVETGRPELPQTAAPSPPPTRSTSPGCMEKLANTAEAAEASTAAMLSAAEHAEAEASAALDVVREQVLAAAAAHEEVQARARAARMQVSEAQAALAIAKERRAIAEQAHQAASGKSPGITARKVAAMAQTALEEAESAAGHAEAIIALEDTAAAAAEAKEHLEELVKAEQQVQSEHWRLRLHTSRAAAAASLHGAMHGAFSHLARLGASHGPGASPSPESPDGASPGWGWFQTDRSFGTPESLSGATPDLDRSQARRGLLSQSGRPLGTSDSPELERPSARRLIRKILRSQRVRRCVACCGIALEELDQSETPILIEKIVFSGRARRYMFACCCALLVAMIGLVFIGTEAVAGLTAHTPSSPPSPAWPPSPPLPPPSPPPPSLLPNHPPPLSPILLPPLHPPSPPPSSPAVPFHPDYVLPVVAVAVVALLAAYCVWLKYFSFAYYYALEDSDDEGPAPPSKQARRLGKLSAETLLDFIRMNEAEAIQHFRDMDVDMSGMVAKHNFVGAIHRMGFSKATLEECNTLFNFFDVDGSGTIPYPVIDQKLHGLQVASSSASTSSEAMQKCSPKSPPKNSNSLGPLSVHAFREFVRNGRGKTVIQHFREMDEDGSGTITKKEFAVAVRKMGFEEATRDECDVVFSYLDADGGGTLPYSEIDKRLREKTTPPPPPITTSSPSACASYIDADGMASSASITSDKTMQARTAVSGQSDSSLGSPASPQSQHTDSPAHASQATSPGTARAELPAKQTANSRWPTAASVLGTAADALPQSEPAQPSTPGRAPHPPQRTSRDSDGNTVWDRLNTPFHAQSPRRSQSPEPYSPGPAFAPETRGVRSPPELPSLASREGWTNAAFFPFTWPIGAAEDGGAALDTPAPKAAPEKSLPPRERGRAPSPPPLPDSPRSARWRSERHRVREARSHPWRTGASPRKDDERQSQSFDGDRLAPPSPSAREPKEPHLWSFSSALDVGERVSVLRHSTTRKMYWRDTVDRLRVRMPWASARSRSPESTARGQEPGSGDGYLPEDPLVSPLASHYALAPIGAPLLRTEASAEQKALRQQQAYEDRQYQLREASLAARSNTQGTSTASVRSTRATGSRRVPGTLSVYCGDNYDTTYSSELQY